MGHLNTGRWVSKPPVGSMVDWSHPLSKGLVGCWLMNEGGGKKVKNLANNRNGIFVGSTASWKTGSKGKSVYLYGASSNPDYVSCGSDFPTLPKNAFSIVCLVKTDNVSALYNGLVSRTTGAYPTPFDLYIEQNTPLVTLYWGGDSSHLGYIKTTNALTLGKWTHIVAVLYRLDLALIYFDGKVQSNSSAVTGTQDLINSSDVRIGSRGDVFTALNGQIGYAYIYNRALSPSEVQQLYQDPYQFIYYPTYYGAEAEQGLVWSTSEVVNVI